MLSRKPRVQKYRPNKGGFFESARTGNYKDNSFDGSLGGSINKVFDKQEAIVNKYKQKVWKQYGSSWF